jgi:RadC-like JAB domain
MTTAEVLHEEHHHPLRPSPYSSKSLINDDFLVLQAYRGGWIVTSHGVHMGFVKKLKKGWKIDPVGMRQSGDAYEKCKLATELLDLFYAAQKDQQKPEVKSSEAKEEKHHPNNALPTELLERAAKALGWTKEQAASVDPWVLRDAVFHHDPRLAEEIRDVILRAKPSSDCGCAPKIAVVRPDTYEKCLARAAAIGPITSTKKVWELLGAEMSKEEQETFVVIPLDARYQLRGGIIEVHKGARAAVAVSTSEILKAVLVAGADRFIVVHNHPSGKATPSQADKDLTKNIEKATKALHDVVFLDHVIIGRKQFFSIRENKLYKAQ